MKRKWILTGTAMLVVVVVAVVGLGTVAFAEPSDEGSGWPNFRQQLHETIASVLGITVEEYDQAVDQAQEQVVAGALADGWLTEEQAELWQWRMDQAPEGGMRGHGLPGVAGPRGGMLGSGESPISIAADQLGLSLTELLTKLQDGQSIADVAAEHGVDSGSIVAAYLAEVSENLDEAVAEGRLTEKQAELMLSNMEERITAQIENTGGAMLGGALGGFGGRGKGGRGGGFFAPGMF